MKSPRVVLASWTASSSPVYCVLPTADRLLSRIRAHRDRRQLPRRLSGRSRRRQRRQEARHHRRRRGHLCLVREPDVEEADRDRRQADPGIISSATADLDGDGKAEIAIAYEFAMNEPTKGKLLLARAGQASSMIPGRSSRSPTSGASTVCAGATSTATAASTSSSRRSSGPRPGRPDINQPAGLIVLSQRTGNAGQPADWTVETTCRRPVIHAIEVARPERDGRSEILTADNSGVAADRLAVEPTAILRDL